MLCTVALILLFVQSDNSDNKIVLVKKLCANLITFCPFYFCRGFPSCRCVSKMRLSQKNRNWKNSLMRNDLFSVKLLMRNDLVSVNLLMRNELFWREPFPQLFLLLRRSLRDSLPWEVDLLLLFLLPVVCLHLFLLILYFKAS